MNRYIKIDPAFDDINGWYHKSNKMEIKTIISKTLRVLGYKNVSDSTGGDMDFIIVDNKRKEWIYWEHGFYPFSHTDTYPNKGTLKYWNRNRN